MKFQEKDAQKEAKWESIAQALQQQLEKVRAQYRAKLEARKLAQKSLQARVLELEAANEQLTVELARTMERFVGSPPRVRDLTARKGPKQSPVSKQPSSARQSSTRQPPTRQPPTEQSISSRRSSTCTVTDHPEVGTELADMWPELAGAWEPVKKQNPMHKELLKSALHRELRTQTSNKRSPQPERPRSRLTRTVSPAKSASSGKHENKVSPRTGNRAPAAEKPADFLDLATLGRLAPYLQDPTSSSEDSDYGDD